MTITSPSGRTLHLRTTQATTSQQDSSAKLLKIKLNKEDRLAENRQHLKDPNIRAFLKAIADAEGGDYDFQVWSGEGEEKR